jgi:hypothetical protein
MAEGLILEFAGSTLATYRAVSEKLGMDTTNPKADWPATMSWLIESPRPVPSPAGLVVKNGLNIFSRVSSVTPDPLSEPGFRRSNLDYAFSSQEAA